MKIFSLNIWFSENFREERTNKLINYLLDNDFDIICLQEAIPEVLSRIYKNIHLIYPFIHTNLKDDFYGICIISKYKIKNKEILNFKDTYMQRCLLSCIINDIIIATTHLESEFGKNCEKKINQFNNSIKLLSQYNKVCFIGDTNLTPKNDKFLNCNDFNDVYLTLDNSKENKYTYDGKTNKYIKNKIRSRIDRAYVKNIKPISFSIEKNIIMSDHYGIKLLI